MLPDPEPAPMQKGPDAFRTISEVAEDLDIPQHVLRFWETRFSTIRPLKRGGGRRYYRPDDVELLKGIRHLLYGQGYTIKGVQRILREDGPRFVQAVGRGEREALARRPEPDDKEDAGSEDAAGTPSRVAQPPSPAAAAMPADLARGSLLAEADAARLREALDELLECERILGSLNAS